ncbi:hypothetical protein C8J57DRAFT_1524622 [Mycena rebaudengoi]|nr:hypothetical protein C8J57DRAFT_1524622 [Mycena rebaudengoi]
MKFNTVFVSTVLLACTSLQGGVQAVASFTPWRSISNTTLCVQTVSPANGSPLVVSACDPTNLSQLWSWIPDGGTIYRLQNADSAFPLCAWIDGGPTNNQTVKLGECIEESAVPISNFLWDSGAPLPSVVQLRSHFHFTMTNSCIDIVGSNVVMQVCNTASLSQKWIGGIA